MTSAVSKSVLVRDRLKAMDCFSCGIVEITHALCVEGLRFEPRSGSLSCWNQPRVSTASPGGFS